MSDDDIWALSRGGHDAQKVYAAYHAAVNHTDQPTVILAKTVKGYGMGEAGEGQNITHQQKKMGEAVLRDFRDRFRIDVPDDQIAEVPFLPPDAGSKEQAYLQDRRAALGGSLPARRRRSSESLEVPPLSAFESQLKGTGERQISTTMAFVRILTTLLRDKQIGKRIVPIVPDESRTFGMEGMFRQFGIFSQVGQLYQPEDANQLMFYKEDKSGQLLQEGINEPGAMSSWIAAATSYSTNDVPMIPFYIYYSMFGFQRVGDLAWASGDMRARGFLMGGTAGRTTLNGEGLQHEDGHSHVIGRDDSKLRLLRSDVLLRGGGDHPGRAAPDVRRAGGHLLLHHRDERELPASRAARGSRGRGRSGIVKGMYLFRDGQGRQEIGSAGAAARLRHDPARGHRGRRPAGAGLERCGRHLERAELHRAGPRRHGGRAVEHAASQRGAPAVLCRDPAAGRPDGPAVAATDYIRAFADQIRP